MSRTGGDLVVESLTALGARTAFGLPGQHALGLLHALHRASSVHYVGSRTEVNAAFAADGHARMTGEVTPLFVSTGPGALQTLAGLLEAAASSVPVFGISSQIPSVGLGGARRGFLHELTDQRASFRDVVKHTRVVRAGSQIPSAIAEAWQIAASAPMGPVWIEIPQDVLLGPAGIPVVSDLSATPAALVPRSELITEAAAAVRDAQRPVILAGGGVIRSGAQPELLTLAEKLGAPVITTFGGKGAFPWNHELSLQSWLEDRHTTEVLQDADVLLVIGSGLGELSSSYYTYRPRGRIIQIEADLGKLESNHSALGIHADARLALRALIPLVEQRNAVVPDLLPKVQERLDGQDLALERDVLASVRAALPDDAPSFWDMTILAYWAWSAWDPRQGAMCSAQGAGGLGYAFPAALGAASTVDGPVLAVSGDGGAMYGLSELATAKQHNLNVTWLIVDDGGYGILREYMTDAFGEASGTELARPDFVALAESFGVPAVRTTPERLRADLAEALSADGPRVVVLPALLKMFAPTHLEHR